MEPSYASGTSSTPLLGDTIGDNLDRTIAGVRRPRGARLGPPGPPLHVLAVRRGGRPLRPRVHRGRRSSRATGSGSGARTAPSGRSSSTGRRRPGSSSSTSTRPTGRPSSRTCSSSPAAGCWWRRPRSRRPTTCGWSTTSAATSTGSSGSCSSAATGRSSSRAASACPPTSWPTARPRPSSTTRSTSSTRAARPASPRAPRSATTTSSTTATSSGAAAATPRRTGSASRCRYYHCFGMVMGNLARDLARRLHGHPGAGVRAGRHAPGGPGRELHEPLRRADDVHRRARASGVLRVRPVVAADRDHGRLAVPDRDDEAVRERDAHGGGHDLLRHDRDLAGVDADRRRRPAREARRDRRAASIRTSR